LLALSLSKKPEQLTDENGSTYDPQVCLQHWQEMFEGRKNIRILVGKYIL